MHGQPNVKKGPYIPSLPCCTAVCTQYNNIHSHTNTSPVSTTDHLPNSMCYAWSEVLPAVLMSMQVFWNVTVQDERLLYAVDEGTGNTVSHRCRLEFSGNVALYYFTRDRLRLSPTLKMEALALTQQTARHNFPHSLCCENLPSHIIYVL
jgi:hypothetical protein